MRSLSAREFFWRTFMSRSLRTRARSTTVLWPPITTNMGLASGWIQDFSPESCHPGRAWRRIVWIYPPSRIFHPKSKAFSMTATLARKRTSGTVLLCFPRLWRSPRPLPHIPPPHPRLFLLMLSVSVNSSLNNHPVN